MFKYPIDMQEMIAFLLLFVQLLNVKICNESRDNNGNPICSRL